MNDRRPDRTRPTREPVPRARSGAFGHHFPRTGTEPVTAQSALGLRLLLAAVFLPLFTAAAVLFGIWAAQSGPGESPGRGPLVTLTVVCALLALATATDLTVVLRRLRRERGTRRGTAARRGTTT
ncbi:DUF6343 family protein [Streptomyces sp. TRM68367]|uniref:DUF6343 family protein n=1 Tax=Streptomyces sp. TRM68367 TaxID=2758415 RepID=UPI00165BBE23|nr:DUF6343 family protein [Streptomyces sp. TRM68367]MBC9727622.1 hypothetical protein [Streptomyces sp. TRM68367]